MHAYRTVHNITVYLENWTYAVHPEHPCAVYPKRPCAWTPVCEVVLIPLSKITLSMSEAMPTGLSNIYAPYANYSAHKCNYFWGINGLPRFGTTDWPGLAIGLVLMFLRRSRGRGSWSCALNTVLFSLTVAGPLVSTDHHTIVFFHSDPCAQNLETWVIGKKTTYPANPHKEPYDHVTFCLILKRPRS